MSDPKQQQQAPSSSGFVGGQAQQRPAYLGGPQQTFSQSFNALPSYLQQYISSTGPKEGQFGYYADQMEDIYNTQLPSLNQAYAKYGQQQFENPYFLSEGAGQPGQDFARKVSAGYNPFSTYTYDPNFGKPSGASFDIPTQYNAITGQSYLPSYWQQPNQNRRMPGPQYLGY